MMACRVRFGNMLTERPFGSDTEMSRKVLGKRLATVTQCSTVLVERVFFVRDSLEENYMPRFVAEDAFRLQRADGELHGHPTEITDEHQKIPKAGEEKQDDSLGYFGTDAAW